jgi:hypothetical protein
MPRGCKLRVKVYQGPISVPSRMQTLLVNYWTERSGMQI